MLPIRQAAASACTAGPQQHAATFFEQAEEKGGPDVPTVVARLRRSPYAAQFRAALGADIFDRRDAAFDAALMALEVFQQSPADFYPFSSRYDAMLRGQASLSEARRCVAWRCSTIRPRATVLRAT